MKNKLILLLVAVVVLASIALVGCGQVPPAVGFVSPAKTTYYVGDTLDLTGGKVYGDEMADVQLTTSMLDATSYNMAVAGDYTVKGSYNDFEFTFNITVNALPTSYGFVAPGQTTYYVGDSLNLAGGKVTVYGETTQNVDLTVEMLDAATIPTFEAAGTYTIAGSYQGFAFTFDVTVNALASETKFVSPAKKVYALGEKLLLDGATVTVEGTTVEVTADMLDATTLPNFNQVGDYTVKGSYQGFDFAFGVKVYSPYEFKHDADFVYMRAADVSKHVWIRQTDAQGVAGEWTNVSNNDFSKFELTQNKLHVEIEMYVNNYQYSYSADFEFIDVTGVTVGDLKRLPVGESTYVNGYVVAITSTIAFNELILADKSTGEVISVRSIPFGGSVHYMDFESTLAVGDEIVIPVTLANAMTTTTDGKAYSDSGKLYAEYTGGDQLETAVLSKGNTAPISYSNATLVDSQADLKALLGSENRAGNVYTMVHLKGQMKFVLYASSRQIRFWFADDTKIDSLAEQKIDGNCSPVFCDGTQYYTTGATFSEMVLGNKSFGNTSYTDPTTGYYDIYALFIGGNNYYHKFVILRAEDAKPMEATVTNRTFTAPTVSQYTLGSTLNLAGAKITTSYDIKADEVVDVTADMLDATTIPDFTTAGNFTVKGSYQGYEFSFDVAVSSKEVVSIAVEAAPTKTTYTHRQGLKDIDLTGGKIRVNYSDETYEVVDMDASMLPTEDTNWALGTVNYTLSYWGQTVVLPITYQNTALTISQVLQNTPEAASSATTVYEVTGVVVAPVSSYAAAELLIKEKNSNVVIGVWSTGEAVVGKYNALKLGTDIVNVGDEIVFYATLEKGAADTSSIGMRNKVFLRATNSGLVNADLKIVSKGNSVDIALTDSDVTVITNATEFKAFLASETRYYSYVKFVGVQAYVADSSNYNLCYGSKAVTVANIPARVSLNNVKNFKTYLTNASASAASSASQTTNDFYMLFVGGNSKAHHFTILQDSWILPKA